MLLLTGCSDPSERAVMSAFDAYCEQVANDAQPIAFIPPMNAAQLDEYWEAFQQRTNDFGVSRYREKAFPVTPLFPASVTSGKEVA